MILNNYGILLTRLMLEDIEMVRLWRNDSEISSTMIFRDHISEEMQQRWFLSVDNDQNFFFIIRSRESAPLGLCEIKRIDDQRMQGELGIYIYHRELAGPSTAMRAILSVLDFAFYDLKIEMVVASILHDNTASVEFNKKLGFELDELKGNAEVGYYRLVEDRYSQKVEKLKKILK